MMTAEQIIDHCNSVIAMAAACKGSYFWKPGENAGTRRYNEQRRNIPSKKFVIDGVEWSVGFSYRESCSYVYASGSYYKDGSKVTLVAVKGLVKRLTSQEDKSEEKLPNLRKVARANTVGFGSPDVVGASQTRTA